MQVKIAQATSMLTKYLQAKLVPMLIGSPGIGKSQIVHKIAEEFNLKMIDIRLGQCDLTDLLGFPKITGTKAGYVPMDTFPIEGDPIPEGYSGWLIFMDEINGAVPALQGAAYKLILDKMVGNYHLHKNVAIICAGNMETDNGVVNPIPTPLQSRMVHIELVADTKEWLDWAASNGIDQRITSYINFKPGNLYTFKPDHTDHTYGAPRTWEFVNRVLGVVDEGDSDFLPMLAGTVSDGLAQEFVSFCKIYKDLPTIPQISKAPDAIRVPVEPSILFALSGSIAHNASKENVESLMKFVGRMPIEFQIVTVRELIRRNKLLAGHTAIQHWVSKNAVALF